MQIENFKVFCDLVETESFTKAARINRVTQSAVSQQLSSMESVCKSPLVERSKRAFRLTREGQVLYDYSKQIMRAHDSLFSKMQEIKDIVSGPIQVSTIYSIGLYDLPPYLKTFLQAYPTVNVHVEYRRYDQVYEDVLSNMVDMGFVAFPQQDAKLDIIPLHKDTMVLICHPNHPLARNEAMKFHGLSGQKMVRFTPDTPTRKTMDRILKDHGVKVHYAMEFDNIETVKRAVEIDVGVAMVPRTTAVQEVARGTLAEVTFEDVKIHFPVVALYRKNRVLSSAMKQFIRILKG